MSFDVSAADIAKLGKMAWQLWELGFSRAKNAVKQYAEFGADIQHFARNLQKLGQVIENVTKQVPISLPRKYHDWDLKSLLQICGDFRKTLKECQQLLRNAGWFERGRDNFICNIRWNLSVEPHVTALRNRVAFHNIKIATILKPLELKLLLDLRKDIYNVHGDLTSQITELHEILRRIEKHGVRVANGESKEIFDAPPDSPRVPDYLEERFKAAIEATNPELRNQAKFPLLQGINAFHHHFEQSTSKFHPENTSNYFAERTPEPAPGPTQFLNLMKSIWIVKMIKQGDEYAQSVSDKLWECYVKELDEKCQREFSRFKKIELPSKRLKEPDPRILKLLREEEFGIWLEDDDDEFNYQPGLDSLNEILHITLASPGRNRKEELVLRWGDTKLELHRLSSRTNLSPDQKTWVMEVNLPVALLVPLYATPSSTPDALNIVFQGDKSLGNAISLSFLSLKDLLDFQQAIIGYHVSYDKKDIKTLIYTRTRFLRGKRLSEHGRVQIWTPRRLEGPQQSQGLPEEPSQVRKCLIATASQGQPGESSQFREGSIASSTTQSSARSTLTSQMSHLSSIMEESSIADSSKIPGLPILVFYLSVDGVGGDEISLLTIEMDPATIIKDHSCSCGRDRSNCIHSIIERPGDLMAQRVEADSRGPLNLASLGVYQKPKSPTALKKMSFIQIDFRTRDERVKFEDRFRVTQRIYKMKHSLYYWNSKKETQDHSSSGLKTEYTDYEIVSRGLKKEYNDYEIDSRGLKTEYTDYEIDSRGLKTEYTDYERLRLKMAQNGSNNPTAASPPRPLNFEYNGNLVWEGLKTYENCGEVMGDVLTISRSKDPLSHCYIARSVSEFLSEYYPAFGLKIICWITELCRQCKMLKVKTRRTVSPLVEEIMIEGATNATIKGRLEAGKLRWELSTNSQQFASRVKSALSWTLSALRCQPQDAEGLYLWTQVSLDIALPEIKRFEPTRIRSYCWINLFSYASIATIPSINSEKDGLEIDFNLLVQLAAVDQEIVTEDGTILFGFDTALIPLDPPKSRRWHFLATKGKQITPARVKKQFGIENKIEGSNFRFAGTLEQDHREGNVYVGWCTAPVVTIGKVDSDTAPVGDISMSSGLDRVKELEELVEKTSGKDVSFFSRIGFLGSSVGASNGNKREKKFKQASIVAKYKLENQFEGVLSSARSTPCILWDHSAGRAWLISAISALLFASMRYIKWRRYSFKKSQINGQYEAATVDLATDFTNTTTGPEDALRKNQLLLVDKADGVTVNDEISFGYIVKRMWTEMSIGYDLCSGSIAGTKLEEKGSILGYDLNEAVCENRKYLRSLPVTPCVESWQPLTYFKDPQVIFCRDIGTVIRCNSPAPESQDCTTRNYPEGALSCLIEDLRSFYGECWNKPLNIPLAFRNTGALSIGSEYVWIPPKEFGCCSKSLQYIIASKKTKHVKLEKKSNRLQTIVSPNQNGGVLPPPPTFPPVLVTFGYQKEVVVRNRR